MMRLFSVFLALAILCPAAAQAGSKPWPSYEWWPWHWMGLDFERPYLDDGKIPHNIRWDKDEWTPQDWTEARGGDSKNVIDGLYAAEIITDQYKKDGVPALEVGYNFMRLSDQDKRRVAAYVDQVFGITAPNTNDMFYIVHKDHCDPIGVYNRHGLQIQ